ncbi:Isoleucine--tRNA ligase, partial [termite gut metagenome]
ICNQVLANSLVLGNEMENGVELEFDDFSLFVDIAKNTN